MKIDIFTITIEELCALESQKVQGEFNSVIIVPVTGSLHDSGYRRMKFAYLRRDEVARVTLYILTVSAGMGRIGELVWMNARLIFRDGV